MNNKEQRCCQRCEEAAEAFDKLSVSARRAMTSLQNASMSLASLDHEAAKRHIRSARKHLANHQP